MRKNYYSKGVFKEMVIICFFCFFFLGESISQVSIGLQLGLDAFNIGSPNNGVLLMKSLGEKDYVVNSPFTGFICEYRQKKFNYFFDFKFTNKDLRVTNFSFNPPNRLFFRCFSNSLGGRYSISDVVSILGGVEFNIFDKIEVTRVYSDIRESFRDRTYSLGARLGIAFTLDNMLFGSYFSHSIGGNGVFSRTKSFNLYLCYKLYNHKS